MDGERKLQPFSREKGSGGRSGEIGALLSKIWAVSAPYRFAPKDTKGMVKVADDLRSLSPTFVAYSSRKRWRSGAVHSVRFKPSNPLAS